MHKGAAVSYRGQPGTLKDFHLDVIGDVDAEGRGVLVPAMVGDVELQQQPGRVIEVPLRDLVERS